jgi:hypothetical protein
MSLTETVIPSYEIIFSRGVPKVVISGRMHTMKHLINLFSGVGSALELLPEARRYQVDRRGFSTDARRLRGDFETVARGLRKQLKRESANYRTR